MSNRPADDTTKPAFTMPTIDSEQIKAALAPRMEELGQAMQNMSTAFHVRGAMGAAWTGDNYRTREILQHLSAERLAQVRQAALTLAALAEAIAEEGGRS